MAKQLEETTSDEPDPAAAAPKVRTLACLAGVSLERGVPTELIREYIREPENLVWVDVQDPGPEELSMLLEEFGFHPLALEDVAKAQQRAKVDEYKGYLFVVMYGVAPGGFGIAAGGQSGSLPHVPAGQVGNLPHEAELSTVDKSSLPGINVVPIVDDRDPMGNNTRWDQPQATVQGRRLNRFRERAVQSREAASRLPPSIWDRWNDSLRLFEQKYHPIILRDGSLAELLLLEDGVTRAGEPCTAGAMLIVKDKCVGFETSATLPGEGRQSFVLSDLDSDGVLDVGFEFHGQSHDPDDNERFGARPFGYRRYWLGLYRIEPRGFRSILPEQAGER